MKILIPILMLLGLSGCVSYEEYREGGKRENIPWSMQRINDERVSGSKWPSIWEHKMSHDENLEAAMKNGERFEQTEVK